MEAQLGRAKKRKQKQSRQSTPTTAPGPVPPPHLSSPESAYSTGYSTDGTSPGTAPDQLAAPIPVIVVCATPSPRPRCRIRTNPWLGGSPKRKPPHLFHQQSLQCPSPHPQLHHAPFSLDSHPLKFNTRSPHLSPHLSPEPTRSPYRGASSDEECRGLRPRGRETAILSDVDFDSHSDTGLDGGDEDEPDDCASPSRRRARRRRPPRRPPRSAGATPPRVRRRNHAPSAPPVRERDPLLEADREAERKYRELIREAEKLLVTVSRAPLEPPHNPRVRELRATERGEAQVPRAHLRGQEAARHGVPRAARATTQPARQGTASYRGECTEYRVPADREAKLKFRELICEAKKLLVTVSHAPLEPPHNLRVRELRATERGESHVPRAHLRGREAARHGVPRAARATAKPARQGAASYRGECTEYRAPADREAKLMFRELICEAEKLLVTVSRAPLEPPHNPRVRELQVEAPRRSPERTHITNFMRANSPEPPRRLSPVAKRSPLALPPPPPPRIHPPSPTDRPHSEPPKRKAYARDEVLPARPSDKPQRLECAANTRGSAQEFATAVGFASRTANPARLAITSPVPAQPLFDIPC
ncbi:Uncharacterized protein OBRU01_00940, partial [Operophtera brumata]